MKKITAILLLVTSLFTFSSGALSVYAGEEEMAVGQVNLPAPPKDHPHLLELFETYAPDLVDEFKAYEEDHNAFHLERQELIDQQHLLVRESLESIKSDLDAGIISKEEAIAEKDAILSTIQESKAAIQSILEDKKTALESEKEINQSLRQSLKEALSAETIDEEAIYTLLDESLQQMANHLAIDVYYASLVDQVLSNHLIQ